MYSTSLRGGVLHLSDFEPPSDERSWLTRMVFAEWNPSPSYVAPGELRLGRDRRRALRRGGERAPARAGDAHRGCQLLGGASHRRPERTVARVLPGRAMGYCPASRCCATTGSARRPRPRSRARPSGRRAVSSVHDSAAAFFDSEPLSGRPLTKGEPRAFARRSTPARSSRRTRSSRSSPRARRARAGSRRASRARSRHCRRPRARAAPALVGGVVRPASRNRPRASMRRARRPPDSRRKRPIPTWPPGASKASLPVPASALREHGRRFVTSTGSHRPTRRRARRTCRSSAAHKRARPDGRRFAKGFVRGFVLLAKGFVRGFVLLFAKSASRCNWLATVSGQLRARTPAFRSQHGELLLPWFA